MVYAQFYQKSAIRNALVEATGDRGVFILDGRNSLATQKADSRAQAEKRGYLGFRIMTGETFTRARTVTGIIVLDPTHWSNEGIAK